MEIIDLRLMRSPVGRQSVTHADTASRAVLKPRVRNDVMVGHVSARSQADRRPKV